MNKTGRNDPCPCNSGKKFKKCCEIKNKQKRFQAEALQQEVSGTHKVSSLFLKNAIPQISKSIDSSSLKWQVT